MSLSGNRFAKRTWLAGAVLLALLGAPLGAVTPATPTGLWRTDDGKAVIRISACGDRLCGRIAEVLDSGPGVPRTDVNNPDPRLRTRPLVGLLTLSGFARHGKIWDGGRAYDPKSGKSYRSTLQLESDGSLKVTGCVLFVCQSRRWTRST